MHGYLSPENAYYDMTTACMVKQRQRTRMYWLYGGNGRMERHSPDVRPGLVHASIITQMEDTDDPDDDQEKENHNE
jgi:hypothetical protein